MALDSTSHLILPPLFIRYFYWQVFKAIRSDTKATKDKITIEEVQRCLDDLDEPISSQKQVEKS